MAVKEWVSKIDGKDLRELIASGDSFKILKEIEYLLWRVIHNPKAYKLDEYDVEEFRDLLDVVNSDTHGGEDELLSYIEGEDWIEDIQELVNDRLAQFYDLCDSNRIWVTL